MLGGHGTIFLSKASNHRLENGREARYANHERSLYLSVVNTLDIQPSGQQERPLRRRIFRVSSRPDCKGDEGVFRRGRTNYRGDHLCKFHDNVIDVGNRELSALNIDRPEEREHLHSDPLLEPDPPLPPEAIEERPNFRGHRISNSLPCAVVQKGLHY